MESLERDQEDLFHYLDELGLDFESKSKDELLDCFESSSNDEEVESEEVKSDNYDTDDESPLSNL